MHRTRVAPAAVPARLSNCNPAPIGVRRHRRPESIVRLPVGRSQLGGRRRRRRCRHPSYGRFREHIRRSAPIRVGLLRPHHDRPSVPARRHRITKPPVVRTVRRSKLCGRGRSAAPSPRRPREHIHPPGADARIRSHDDSVPVRAHRHPATKVIVARRARWRQRDARARIRIRPSRTRLREHIRSTVIEVGPRACVDSSRPNDDRASVRAHRYRIPKLSRPLRGIQSKLCRLRPPPPPPPQIS